MKKIFLLISVLTLSMAVSAKQWEIGPTSPKSSDNIRRTIRDNAAIGDTIVLADGTYTESEVIEFSKSLTVIAADGANPVIAQHYYSRVMNGSKVKFVGITFDGSLYNSGAGASDHCFYPDDDNDGNELHFENCEFKAFPSRFICIASGKKLDSCIMKNCTLHAANAVLYNQSADLKYFKMDGCEVYGMAQQAICAGSSASHMDSCIVNDCYFYNNAKTAIYFEKSSVEGKETCDGVIVTNSTFANSTAAVSSIICVYNYDYSKASTIKVKVDHCTFYNNEPTSTDHGVIRVYKSTDVNISNCIFAHPTAIAQKATSCYGGTIKNCLVHNYTYTTSGHRTDDITPTANITANPLFTDAANSDFSYPGNWSTGNISPARGSASDNSDLGDPRWYTAETLPLPTTNFASPYSFIGTKAQLLGSFALNANDSIQSQDKDYDGIANWKFHAERSCQVQVTLNINAENTSGHRYEVELFDANNVLVGTSIAEAANAWTKGDQILGTLKIPAIGDYKIRLTNHTDHSSTVINGITLSYYGGAIQNISTSTNTTLNVADAWFSGCTRDNEKTYIQYPSSSTSSAWMKWNIATSETKYYDLTVNVNTAYNHGFTVAIYEDEEADPIASVTEGSYVETTGDGLGLEVGRVNLVGGKKYVVKVTNAPSGSQAKVTSVVFAPVVATSTALPNTLEFSNAVLSPKAHITDGMLYFNEIGDTNPQGQWAQWEVTTDHNGLFLFTMGVASTSQQSYKITIKDNSENELEYFEANPGSGNQTIKHYFALNAGTYFVKVENTYSYSNGHLTSLAVTEPAGVVTLDENAMDNSTWSAKVGDNNTYDVQIIRSFKGGMNNTFCLPFAVSSSQCKEVFGNDVEIRTLDEATIEEGNFVLNLNFVTTTSIYQGTPVLIKPARDIVNPVFTGVEFKKTASEPTTKTNANFVGSFVKTPLTASDNLLYVGPENKVFFLSVDYDMPGMRAWFVIHDVPSPKALRSARIIEKEQITTSILNVETSGDAARKVLYNGQIVIIRGNEMYNMQGQHIQ